MDIHHIISNVKKYLPEIYSYIFCSLLSLLLVIWVLQLWNANLAIPFVYNGDALSMNIWIKGLIDNPWWFHNDFLGMPFGQDHYDFPLADTIDLLILKIIGVLTQNYAIAMNLFYILTFPITAITTLYVFRELRISMVPSIVGSLLYTFIPYHFLRGEPHILFTFYFLIPLIVLVIIWIYEGKSVIFNFKENKFDFWNFHTGFSLLICGLMALQQLYYLYFSCFLFIVVGTILSINNKNKTQIIAFFLLIMYMITILLMSIIPVLLYQSENGPNREAILRTPTDSELYGLKITQLILPIPGHRIPIFAEINKRYSSSAPLVNENMFAALGIIGAIGFIFLIGWIFIRVEGTTFFIFHEFLGKLNCLSILNLSAILLATIGGFGSIVAYGFFYDIRSYNRISIFIAFFAITTVIVLLEAVQKKYSIKKIPYYGILCLLLIGGILDQTSPSFIPDYNSTNLQYSVHQQFFEKIEKRMPINSMIFQFPYLQYMGWGLSSKRLPPYAEAIPYLHSEKLRWSYGAMVNRKADVWQRAVMQLPLEDQINKLSFAGFSGILVDMEGYKKEDVKIVSNLTHIIHTKPIVSADKRYYFFDMSNYISNLKSTLGKAKWDYLTNDVLNIIIFKWSKGFSILEESKVENWRWCGSTGQLDITNPSNITKPVTIETTFATGYPELSHLKISSSNFNDEINVNNEGTIYHKTIFIPPEGLKIIFSTDAKKVLAPGDTRELVFLMRNFKTIEPITSTRNEYDINETLNFSEGGNSIAFQESGWSVPENSMTWTDGPKASLNLFIDFIPLNLDLHLNAQGFTGQGLDHQTVMLSVNDKNLPDNIILDGQMRNLTIPIPPGYLISGPNKLTLILPNATSPKSLGVSDDIRQLGIAVRSISLATPIYNKYSIGNIINFANGGNSNQFQISGWSAPESNFTWTNGPKASLNFVIDNIPDLIRFDMQATPFIAPGIDNQTIIISINDKNLSKPIVMADPMRNITISIPKGYFISGANSLSVILPNASSPKSLGISNDTRQLGIAVSSINFLSDDT